MVNKGKQNNLIESIIVLKSVCEHILRGTLWNEGHFSRCILSSTDTQIRSEFVARARALYPVAKYTRGYGRHASLHYISLSIPIHTVIFMCRSEVLRPGVMPRYHHLVRWSSNLFKVQSMASAHNCVLTFTKL